MGDTHWVALAAGALAVYALARPWSATSEACQRMVRVPEALTIAAPLVLISLELM